MEMTFGSLIQTQVEVKLRFTSNHFASQKPTALRQFKTKDSFATTKAVIETLFKSQASAYWRSSLLRLESLHSYEFTFQFIREEDFK